MPKIQLPVATQGFLFAIASAALFSVRPIFVKLVYAEGVDTTTLIALRMLFSAPIYALLLILFLTNSEHRNRLKPALVFKICGIGLLGYYLASFLDLLGLQYVTAQLGRMILYTYPTFVVLIGALFFGERITRIVVVALCITYLGTAIIFGHDLSAFGKDVVRGGMYIVGSAIAFAFYLLFSKSMIKQVGSRLFTCIALLAASFAILAHFSITHDVADINISHRATYLILIIAIFCTVIPTFFTTAAVARIGADRTGIVATVGPAFTSLAAVLILSEVFTAYHLAGIALTIAGVTILQRK